MELVESSSTWRATNGEQELKSEQRFAPDSPLLLRMFNACRIPSKPYDYAIKLSEDDPKGAHYIVIRNNSFYKIPLFDHRGQSFSLENWHR